MIFHSKIDKYYISFLLIFLFVMAFIIGAIALLPFLSEDGLIGILISIIILLIMIGITLWGSLSIKYVFNNKYLLVKGGPIKSRIPYENITKISPTTDIFTGYRILSSRNALEIFYKNATLWGSIKISPENKMEFIDELKKRCSNLQIQERATSTVGRKSGARICIQCLRIGPECSRKQLNLCRNIIK